MKYVKALSIAKEPQEHWIYCAQQNRINKSKWKQTFSLGFVTPECDGADFVE